VRRFRKVSGHEKSVDAKHPDIVLRYGSISRAMGNSNFSVASGVVRGNSSSSVRVLTSWKDIANYMGKGVRTVQRWEQDFGLPVRRPFGSGKKAVLARPGDLDSWIALRCRSRAEDREGIPGAAVELCLLSSLAAEIKTAQALRAANHTTRAELQAELAALQQTLAAICRDCSPQTSARNARDGKQALD
jgi:hypothetical protein